MIGKLIRKIRKKKVSDGRLPADPFDGSINAKDAAYLWFYVAQKVWNGTEKTLFTQEESYLFKKLVESNGRLDPENVDKKSILSTSHKIRVSYESLEKIEIVTKTGKDGDIIALRQDFFEKAMSHIAAINNPAHIPK